MRSIRFSDVGVIINSKEELDEIYMTYTALDIPFAPIFQEQYTTAQQHALNGYFIQTARGGLKTKLEDTDACLCLIKYQVSYTMGILDYAVAYHLLKSNQESELIAHLDEHCKEFK